MLKKTVFCVAIIEFIVVMSTFVMASTKTVSYPGAIFNADDETELADLLYHTPGRVENTNSSSNDILRGSITRHWLSSTDVSATVYVYDYHTAAHFSCALKSCNSDQTACYSDTDTTSDAGTGTDSMAMTLNTIYSTVDYILYCETPRANAGGGTSKIYTVTVTETQ